MERSFDHFISLIKRFSKPSLLLFIIYSQNSLLAYLDNVLNGFFKYLIMITEFKIKCLTDRGLTKCYISKILFYILPVTGSILNCYQENTFSFIFKKLRITNNTLYSNICYLLQIFKKDIILCL